MLNDFARDFAHDLHMALEALEDLGAQWVNSRYRENLKRNG